MSGEDLRARYQLLKLVSDVDASTYHALAHDGSMVMVHVLDIGESEKKRALLDLVETLHPAARKRIIEIGESADAPVVVTKYIMGFRSLELWLRQEAEDPPPGGGSRSDAPPVSDAAEDERNEGHPGSGDVVEMGQFTRELQRTTPPKHPSSGGRVPDVPHETGPKIGQGVPPTPILPLGQDAPVDLPEPRFDNWPASGASQDRRSHAPADEPAVGSPGFARAAAPLDDDSYLDRLREKPTTPDAPQPGSSPDPFEQAANRQDDALSREPGEFTRVIEGNTDPPADPDPFDEVDEPPRSVRRPVSPVWPILGFVLLVFAAVAVLYFLR